MTLSEKEKKYVSLFENAGDAIFIMDGEQFIDCNRRTTDLFGWSKDEILKQKPYELSPEYQPDGRLSIDSAKEKIHAALQGERQSFEWIHTRKDDGAFDAHVTLVRIDIDDHAYIQAIVRDITDSKKNASALAESERKYRTLIESMHEFVLEFDSKGVIHFVNQTMLAATSFDNDEVLGKHISEFVFESDRESFLINLDRLFISGIPIDNLDIRIHTKSFQQLHCIVNIDPLHSDIRGEPLFVLIAFDKSANERTARNLNILAHALMSIREGVTLTDMNENIMYVNDALCTMYGYEEEELVGRNIGMLRSRNNPDNLLIDIYPTTIRTGWQNELLTVRKDGTEFPVFLSTSTVRDEVGRAIAIVGVTTDITEKNLKERQLQQARDEADRANRLKSEFLANMSHEIRTPVNIILGSIAVVEELTQKHISPDDEKFFTSIRQSGKRLLDTIQKVIDISKFHIKDFPFRPEYLPIVQMISRCVAEAEVLASEKNIEMAVDLPSEEVYVHADNYAVSQALLNVVENAIKYTNEGNVRISVAIIRDEIVEMQVADSGVGISEEFLPFVFDDFSQERGGYGRPYEGTGLGLALTKKFLHHCGGSIEVRSTKGQGSTFTIQLPTCKLPTDETSVDVKSAKC